MTDSTPEPATDSTIQMPDRAAQRASDPAEQERRTAEARAFAIALARHAASTRCTNVVLLDLAGISPVTDFFVIATGTSARQMRTVADEVSDIAEQNKYSPLSSSGYEGENWILVDCIDVVVHIFSAAARTYYDLDNLWGDAKKISWESVPT